VLLAAALVGLLVVGWATSGGGAAAVGTLFERVIEIKKRLGDRMGSLATDEWYYGRINALDTRTLKVMVESGAWITREIGGEEVVVPSASQPAPVAEPVRRNLSLVS